MKIMPVSFNKVKVLKHNISFGIGHVVGGYKSEEDTFVRNLPKIDPKKEQKGREIQEDSLEVLSWANSKLQEAEKLYAEAKRIYEGPHHQDKLVGDIIKGFSKDIEGLEMYSELNIKTPEERIEMRYYRNKPFVITKVYVNGKKDEYIFSDDGKLEKLIEGQEDEYTKRNSFDITEGVYTFSPNGYLLTYKQSQEKVCKFDFDDEDAWWEPSIDHTTVDTIMNFDVVGDKPYLKEARTGMKILSDETTYLENYFKYDENGNLLVAD